MDYMQQALSLASLALGQVSPNPAVGAVVVKDDEVVGQGYTQPPGSDHAEIVALKQAGKKARGAALYVSLEPCCYHGRTPPCTDAIIAAGIAEVHYAVTDSNPRVSGKGKQALEQAGIKVYQGEREAEATELNEAFFKHIQTGLPFVTAKFAMSLDGKIAARTGDSRWITGGPARGNVHHLRYVNDAVMVGVNTVLADDPLLTARCCGGRGGVVKKQPLRIIVDSQARVPPTARIFSEAGGILLALGKQVPSGRQAALNRAGAELVQLPGQNNLVDLKSLLVTLGQRQLTSVLVEGGGTLLGSLFDAGLVDKIVAFIAPVIIGGREAKTPVGGRGVAKIADAFKLERVRLEKLGDDYMISGYISH